MVNNMAHFAQLDKNNIGVQVIVGIDEPFDGEAIYAETTGQVWKKTSYNTLGGLHQLGGTPFRKNYAGIGYTYDVQRDAFIPPQPYASWLLDEQTCQWNAPTTYPNDGSMYSWDESTLTWTQL